VTTPRYLLGDAFFFHAYSRGTGPIVIYRDATDFETFSEMLARTVLRFGWELYAYCLMPTHYHLLLSTPREQLSAGMHRLNGGYAKTFNRRHGRVGHLFQSRFRVRVIEEEGYFHRAAAYIVWNPVRAGHCQTPSDWPWSWSSFGWFEEA
jgi:putative transposase